MDSMLPTLLAQMPLPADRKERLVDGFFDAFLTVCRGQDEELRATIQSLDHYNGVVRQKTVTAVEFAATTGALAAGAAPSTRAICTTLDKMYVRSYLMGTALDHRDQALAALVPPLLDRGRHILQLWLDWLFRDGRRLLGIA